MAKAHPPEVLFGNLFKLIMAGVGLEILVMFYMSFFAP